MNKTADRKASWQAGTVSQHHPDPCLLPQETPSPPWAQQGLAPRHRGPEIPKRSRAPSPPFRKGSQGHLKEAGAPAAQEPHVRLSDSAASL